LSIETAEVRRIARLARLDLDDASVERLRRELQSILDHVAVLDELELPAATRAVLPAAGGRPRRSDETRPSLGAERALVNAPDPAADHFRVPQILER
jgi:aspartyl-tRNA(Asn)/glutamyl-tRNA(Gln) amidotransferase subunit C